MCATGTPYQLTVLIQACTKRELHIEKAMEPPIQVQEQGPPPQAVSHVCAAGEHCCMKTIPVQGMHSCLNCDKKMHGGLCGTLWGKGEVIVGLGLMI